ncbi:11756_t:CDS:2, partial [Racocetra persica]
SIQQKQIEKINEAQDEDYFTKEEKLEVVQTSIPLTKKRKGPTVRRVVEIVLQNMEKQMLIEEKVKVTRYDNIQAFLIEELDWEDTDTSDRNRFFKPRALLFFIGQNYQSYKFM